MPPVSLLVRFARVQGLLLVAGTAWGLSFSLAKIATGAGMTPVGITFWQSVFSIIMLTAVLAVRRRPVPLDRAHLMFYGFCGVFGTVLPSVLIFYAAYHLSAGVLSITISTVPLLTVALAAASGAERLAVARVAGIVLGIVAVAMIVAPEAALPDRAASLWVLVSVAAAASYALENVFIALRRPAVSDPVVLLFGMAVVALALLLPLGLATGQIALLSWPPGEAEITILAMATINVVCYGGFIYLVTLAGPVFASQMAYVVTLTGVLWGVVIFSEQHSAWIWAALVVMMAGLTLVRPRNHESPTPAVP
jgi:drug/metabolite transporter (DMT)-like permease